MPSADEFTAALGQAGPQERVLQQLGSVLPVQAVLKPLLCKRAQSSPLPLRGAGGAQPPLMWWMSSAGGEQPGWGAPEQVLPSCSCSSGPWRMHQSFGHPVGAWGSMSIPSLTVGRVPPALSCLLLPSPCSAPRKSIASPQEAFVRVLHHQ